MRETKAYVGWEMGVTTLLGIALGLLAGSVLAYRITLLLENINCFDRSIYFPGWLIASGVTALLSFGIGAIALRKVKYLKLSDVS